MSPSDLLIRPKLNYRSFGLFFAGTMDKTLIRWTMDKTLIRYLQKIGPIKSSDTVNKVGNISALKKFVISSFSASLSPVVLSATGNATATKTKISTG